MGYRNRISTKAIDYSLLMKLAYPLAHPMDKSLDMVLPGSICLCPAQQA